MSVHLVKIAAEDFPGDSILTLSRICFTMGLRKILCSKMQNVGWNLQVYVVCLVGLQEASDSRHDCGFAMTHATEKKTICLVASQFLGQ
jgi:hypothetical protein